MASAPIISTSNGYEYSGSNAGNAILYLIGTSGVQSNTQSNISNNMGYTASGGVNNYYNGMTIQRPFALWLTSIQTGSALQFVRQVTQTRIAYEPVRRAEMNCTFTAVWPVRLLNEMNNFSEAIRQHYFYALANTIPIPMTLVYLATRPAAINTSLNVGTNLTSNPMTFTGWVKAAPNGFQRFQGLFSRTFTMQILTQPTPGITTSESAVVAGKNNSYLPSAADAEKYVNGWYTSGPSGPNMITGVN